MIWKIRNLFSENKRLFLLLPYLFLSLLFIILPFILLIINSFKPIENFDNWEYVKSNSFQKIILRSIFVGIITSLIAIIIAIPYSYIAANSKSRVIKLLLILLIISPLFVFTLSKVFAIKGILIYLVGDFNLISMWVVILGLVYLYLPLTIIPLYNIFSSMPKSIIFASHDLGDRNYKTFFKIALPYAKKAILSTFIFIFILSSTSIVVTSKILDNNALYELVGNRIEKTSNSISQSKIAQTSTISLITLIIIFSCVSLFYFSINIIPKIIVWFNQKTRSKNEKN